MTDKKLTLPDSIFEDPKRVYGSCAASAFLESLTPESREAFEAIYYAEKPGEVGPKRFVYKTKVITDRLAAAGIEAPSSQLFGWHRAGACKCPPR